jgi:hypothetical protein
MVSLAAAAVARVNGIARMVSLPVVVAVAVGRENGIARMVSLPVVVVAVARVNVIARMVSLPVAVVRENGTESEDWAEKKKKKVHHHHHSSSSCSWVVQGNDCVHEWAVVVAVVQVNDCVHEWAVDVDMDVAFVASLLSMMMALIWDPNENLQKHHSHSY